MRAVCWQAVFVCVLVVCSAQNVTNNSGAHKKLTNSTDGGAQEEEAGGISLPPFVQYGLIAVLICFSGLFSGLTLGLMSLDKIGLEIVIGAGTAEGSDASQRREAECAKKIEPIRKNGNLLLCTLLLGNVAVNALLSILMADLTSGTTGFLISTVSIVVLGEIVPQATCSRYALELGSRAVPVMKVIICLLLFFTWPLSKMLDCILGDEIGTIHGKAALMKLMTIHVEHHALEKDEGDIVMGALSYKEKTVGEVMTPINNVKMLNVSERLNFHTIAEIFKSGYSRIPVYDTNKNDIVGVVFTKDLIFIDPEDETPVKSFVQIFGRDCSYTTPGQKLDLTLQAFKQDKRHMMIVQEAHEIHEPPTSLRTSHSQRKISLGTSQRQLREFAMEEREEQKALDMDMVVGVITLEDIIEEILQTEIVDETDVYEDNTKRTPAKQRDRFDYSMLRLLDHRIVEDQMTEEEVKGIATNLCINHKHVFCSTVQGEMVTPADVRRLLRQCNVVTLDPSDRDTQYIYRQDKVDTYCTIVLSGKLEIMAGRDNFVSDVGPWTVLACESLIVEPGAYAPDFTARVRECCRVVRIAQWDFAGVKTQPCSPRGTDVRGGMFSPRVRRNPKLSKRARQAGMQRLVDHAKETAAHASAASAVAMATIAAAHVMERVTALEALLLALAQGMSYDAWMRGHISSPSSSDEPRLPAYRSSTPIELPLPQHQHADHEASPTTFGQAAKVAKVAKVASSQPQGFSALGAVGSGEGSIGRNDRRGMGSPIPALGAKKAAKGMVRFTESSRSYNVLED